MDGALVAAAARVSTILWRRRQRGFFYCHKWRSGFRDQGIDLILDGGKTKGAKSSTVIDVSSSTPQIIRSGAIDEDKIQKALYPPLNKIDNFSDIWYFVLSFLIILVLKSMTF